MPFSWASGPQLPPPPVPPVIPANVVSTQVDSVANTVQVGGALSWNTAAQVFDVVYVINTLNVTNIEITNSNLVSANLTTSNIGHLLVDTISGSVAYLTTANITTANITSLNVSSANITYLYDPIIYSGLVSANPTAVLGIASKQYVDTVWTVANAAFALANVDAIVAQAAFDRANSAWNFASIADITACAAFTQANTAYNQANTSFTQANIATTNANAGFLQANLAYALANTANTKAQAAYNQANTLTGTLTAGTTCTMSPVATGGKTVQAHGLGVAPRFVTAYMECLTAEEGYATGDRLYFTSMFQDGAGNATGTIDVGSNATNTWIIVNSTGLPTILNLTTPAGLVAITAANWKLEATPYKLN